MRTLMDSRWDAWLRSISPEPVTGRSNFNGCRADATRIYEFLNQTDVFDRLGHAEFVKPALDSISFGDLSWGFTALGLGKELSLQKLRAISGGEVEIDNHFYPYRFVVAAFLCATAFADDSRPMANRMQLGQAKRTMQFVQRKLAWALLDHLPAIRKTIAWESR